MNLDYQLAAAMGCMNVGPDDEDGVIFGKILQGIIQVEIQTTVS